MSRAASAQPSADENDTARLILTRRDMAQLEQTSTTVRESGVISVKAGVQLDGLKERILEFLSDVQSRRAFSASLSWDQHRNPEVMEKLCRELFVKQDLRFRAGVIGPDFRLQDRRVRYRVLQERTIREFEGTLYGQNPSEPFFINLGVNVLQIPNNKFDYKMGDNISLTTFLNSGSPEAQRWKGQETKLLVYVLEHGGLTYLSRVREHFAAENCIFKMSQGPNDMLVVETLY